MADRASRAEALRGLEELLVSCFSEPELRALMGRLDLGPDLPGMGIPLRQLAHDAVELLERREGLDRPFFEVLASERPGQRSRVEGVAAGLGVALGTSSPEATRVRAPLPETEERRVRFLHLSDLHFSASRAWDQDPVLAALVVDVGRLRAELGEIHRVVVTGDIANWGKKEEFDRARAWLTGPLARAAGVQADAIRVVAGNHDVDRGAISRAVRNLDADIVREGDEVIAELMQDDKQRELLLQRQAAFLDFARYFHPGLERPWWSAVEELGGWEVRLLGLNTAWLAGSHKDDKGEVDDHRHLVIGALQWNALFPADAPLVDLTVALMHHPWEQLAEWDRRAREEATLQRCGVVLSGHLHDARAARITTPDEEDTLTLAAGACYADPKEGWPHAYQLLELDPGQGRARVHLRTWSARRKEWHADTQRYPKGAKNGVASLSLRRSPRSPKPLPPDPAPQPSPGPEVAPAPDPLADYKQQLISRADVLAQVFRAPGGPSALSKVYVEVRLSAEASELQRAGEDGLFDRTRPWMRRWLAREGAASGLPGGRFKLDDLVTEAPSARWAVLGDPGGGKTTLLRHTALTLLERGQRLPVLLKVSELKGTLPVSAAAVYGAGAEALVRKALRQKRAVVLLDGMDEVTDREAGLAAVRRAATEAGASPLILASRPIGWQRPSPDFAELALCPLGHVEQRQLLDVWVEDPARVGRALARLESTARLRRLAENPLLLTLVALLLREREDIPERRGELYDKAITILLTRAADPQRAQRRLREPDLAKQALAYAALKLHGRSEEVYRTADLLDALQEQERHRANLRELWGGPGAFLTELAETTGLLVPTTASADGAPAFAFPHRTFREHLAAVALERDIGVRGVGEIPASVLKNAAREARAASLPPAAGELGRVLAEARARPERWSEVLALVCALVGPGAADALVRRLAAEGNAPLLQRVVAEAEGLSSDTVLAVLGVERGWRRWEERQQIIQEIPALVGDAGVAVRLLDRLRWETRDGNDLYWIRETLRGVAATEGVDADAARDATETVSRIFDHIPAADLEGAKALLGGWWRTVPPEGEQLGPYKVGSEEHNSEMPIHDVTLTARMSMLAVPVTWEMYLRLDPGHVEAQEEFGGRLRKGAAQAQVPVYNVTWYAATMFAAWVDARLPLEPEWEYACRAGTTTCYWSGDQEPDLARVGWYRGNSGGHPHPVAQKPANPWGLHDIHGNVCEWCLDGYQSDAYAGRRAGLTIDPTDASYRDGGGDFLSADSAARDAYRVLRGGSWFNTPAFARSAIRVRFPPGEPNADIGLRLVLPAAIDLSASQLLPLSSTLETHHHRPCAFLARPHSGPPPVLPPIPDPPSAPASTLDSISKQPQAPQLTEVQHPLDGPTPTPISPPAALEPPNPLPPLAKALTHTLATADLPGAQTALARLREALHQLPMDPNRPYAAIWCALVRGQLGDPEGAEDELRELLPLTIGPAKELAQVAQDGHAGPARGTPLHGALMLRLALRQMDRSGLEAAETTLSEIPESPDLDPFVAHARARLALQRGDAAGALADLEQARQAFRETELPAAEAMAAAGLALACWQLQRAEEARRWLRLVEVLSRLGESTTWVRAFSERLLYPPVKPAPSLDAPMARAWRTRGLIDSDALCSTLQKLSAAGNEHLRASLGELSGEVGEAAIDELMRALTPQETG